jgi:hypothetical protein
MTIKFCLVVSNSSIQRVRISVSSSPYHHEMIHKSELQSPTYSSMISNFIQENLNEETKLFDRRPLLDLLNEHNQLPELENNEKNRKTFSPSPSRILPPKQFSLFRPVIHKKYQV